MYKILIADDESAEVQRIERIVEGRFAGKAEVQSVMNGRLAESIAMLWGADIVLMDIEMPGKSGLEAARGILSEHKEAKIIFITAYPLFDYAREAVKLGASDYILKPVEDADLVASITKAMEQIEAGRQMKAEASAMLDGSAEPSRQARLVAKVQKFLLLNYMDSSLSLESVADRMGISASHLSSIFKKETQSNFSDYLTELRTNAAKNLLSDPLRSAGEIAAAVGYESASYFSRAFKKKTGYSPTEWRSGIGGAQ